MMQQSPVTDQVAEKTSLALKTLEVMLLTRFMDEKMSKLVRQNKGGTFHLPVSGHEMIGAVSALSLTPSRDWGLPYYRDRAFALGLGCSLVDILGAFLARAVKHHSGGRMMPEHFSDKERNIPCQSSCVGSQFLHAVGVAKGLQITGKNDVVYVSSGEGATSQGDFHEALNFACLHQLSVIFVVQDNGWAISVPAKEQTAGGSIVSIARGYPGLSVFDIDGCDYLQTSAALAQAVEKGRAQLGPSVIVAKVPRIGAHSSSDDPSKYKNKEELDEEKLRDPIPRFEAWLLETQLVTQEEIAALRKDAFQRIEDAAVHADQLPFPEKNTIADHIFKAYDDTSSSQEENTSSSSADAIVMVDALNHSLDEEMKRDEHIVVFGQDVAHGKGGVFGVTRTLTSNYGTTRCFNTPLAESSIIGIATGMSFVEPLRPVVEIQFADYLWTGINQLFNELASIHYRSDGEWNCPVVIRMPCGGYIQGGPYHSQSIEAFLAHCPGLKVVIPSNAADAKRLLKTAIRDPNPVIFLEHKALYRQRVFCARKETSADATLPFGKANVVRKGSDLTLVAWGMTVVQGDEVCEELSKEGISIELIDLRTIVPCDIDTVLQSVRKTGKVVIAHEAQRTCGFGAEIAALIAEKAFDSLDAPLIRVTGEHCPVPYCKDLEDAVLPQKSDLAQALRTLAQY